ncbi:MAG: HIT family protein [bacterium]|nr:HIT family protein [bacterium]
MTDACYPCSVNALLPDAPLREAMVVEGGWRVAHAFDTSLPGWLVVVPTRHVTAMDELSDDEARHLGALLRPLSAALREVTGCEKTYVMLFAEQEGFAHLHVHVVPRMAWFTPEQLGPRVFEFLGSASADALGESERDDMAARIRCAMEDA